MTRGGCFFHDLGFPGCDGPIDPAHLVPKARMRDAGVPAGTRWDPRAYVPACRHHHDLFDKKHLRLDLGQYPKSFREFAFSIGFEFFGPREGWLHVGRKAA